MVRRYARPRARASAPRTGGEVGLTGGTAGQLALVRRVRGADPLDDLAVAQQEQRPGAVADAGAARAVAPAAVGQAEGGEDVGLVALDGLELRAAGQGVVEAADRRARDELVRLVAVGGDRGNAPVADRALDVAAAQRVRPAADDGLLGLRDRSGPGLRLRAAARLGLRRGRPCRRGRPWAWSASAGPSCRRRRRPRRRSRRARAGTAAGPWRGGAYPHIRTRARSDQRRAAISSARGAQLGGQPRLRRAGPAPARQRRGGARAGRRARAHPRARHPPLVHGDRGLRGADAARRPSGGGRASTARAASWRCRAASATARWRPSWPARAWRSPTSPRCRTSRSRARSRPPRTARATATATSPPPSRAWSS